MSEINLFQLVDGQATRLNGHQSDLERPLQKLIERNLDVLLGIRFLASEYVTGKAPRLVCIASDFNRYDDHAVQQIDRNIELIRYRKFGEDFLLLEQANAYAGTERRVIGVKVQSVAKQDAAVTIAAKVAGPDKSYAEVASTLSQPLTELLATTEDYILSLGDDVQRKELRLYAAFKRLKNFATIVLQKNRLLLFLHLNPKQLVPLTPNARDVSDIGHWGTGDLEISLVTQADLDAAKALVMMAYEGR